jgi:hypothetical protein
LTETPRDAESATRLVRALRRVVGTPDRPPARGLSEQIAYLERDLQEVRTRLNALFFTVLTAAIGELAARLFA